MWGPTRIAFLQSGRTTYLIRTLDPATGALATVATVDFRKHDIGALAWAPDERLAYLAYDPNGVASITVIGGRTILLRRTHVTGLAWSPDGSRFASSRPTRTGTARSSRSTSTARGCVRSPETSGCWAT